MMDAWGLRVRSRLALLVMCFAAAGGCATPNRYTPPLDGSSGGTDDGNPNVQVQDLAPTPNFDLGGTGTSQGDASLDQNEMIGNRLDARDERDAPLAQNDALSGPCQIGKECDEGATRTVACGRCGTRTDRCTSMCKWMMGTCEHEKECAPLSTREQNCGMCGTRKDTCTASCEWSPGTCTGESGSCDPQLTPKRITVCGKCNRGMGTDTCLASCTWQSGTCADPDADVGKLTVAYDRTINAQYMNVEVGGACDPGNRRESFKVEKVSGTGQCEVSTWSRLQGGVPTDVDDPAWCGLAVIFYDPVVCRFTITEKKVCP